MNRREFQFGMEETKVEVKNDCGLFLREIRIIN